MTSTELRVFAYQHLLASGRPPLAKQIAQHFSITEGEAKASIASLKIGKTLLPHPVSGEIWMAGPFAAEPTAYVVRGQNVTWWANCAWDMFGIPVIAGQETGVDMTCTDCGTPMQITASPVSPPTKQAVVHVLVPARNWYDDVGFT